MDYARFIEYKFENDVTETALGEPQIWIEFESGRSVEITHEENGLDIDEQYYSFRYHCSNDEFDNGDFHSTCGIIDTWIVNGTIDMADHLWNIVSGIYNEKIKSYEIKNFMEADI